MVADAAFPSPSERLEEAWKEDQLRRCLSKQNPGQVGQPKVGEAGCVASSPDERSNIRNVDPEYCARACCLAHAGFTLARTIAIARPEDTYEWVWLFQRAVDRAELVAQVGIGHKSAKEAVNHWLKAGLRLTCGQRPAQCPRVWQHPAFPAPCFEGDKVFGKPRRLMAARMPTSGSWGGGGAS